MFSVSNCSKCSCPFLKILTVSTIFFLDFVILCLFIGKAKQPIQQGGKLHDRQRGGRELGGREPLLTTTLTLVVHQEESAHSGSQVLPNKAFDAPDSSFGW